MADITPRIQPTNDPSYTRDSRAIDVPNNIQPRGQGENSILPKGVQEGDKSAAFVGQAQAYAMQAEAAKDNGLANLFSDVVGIASYGLKAADTMIKKSIENQVYDSANAEREQYTEALETIKNNGGMQSFLNANASMDETPTELEDLGGTLSSMSGAQQAGKMSNTMYYGRLTALAKDLRARYPGYRDYIDQQFSSVTGVNPANAYVTQLLGDINRNTSSATQQRNKTLNFIQQNSDIPGASRMYQRAVNGEISMPDVLDWAAPYHQAKLRAQMMDIQRKQFDGERDQLKKMATDQMNYTAEMISNNFIQDMKIKIGADTHTGIQAFIKKAESGVYTDQQIREAGEFIMSQKSILRQNLIAEFARAGKNGRSLTTDVGGIDERNKIINDSLMLLDSWGERIYKKEWGAAFKSANELEARQTDFNLRIVKQPKVGTWVQMMGVLDKNGGQAVVNSIITNAFTMGLDKDVVKYFTDLVGEAHSQTAEINGGTPTTMLSGMSEGAKAGIKDTKVNQAIVQSTMQGITDPNLSNAVKDNLAKFAFSNGNYGFIEKLNKDGVDSRGRTVPGQYITFRQMTSPAATAAMKKLGDTSPQAWSNYQNWAEVTFRNLFLREIKDLSQYQDTAGIKISWDNKSNQFITEISGAERPFTRGAREAVNRVNIGLKSMSEISKARGDGPDAVSNYLMQKLEQVGFEPNAKTTGFPQKMYDEIAKRKSSSEQNINERKSISNEYNRSNFAPEELTAPTIGEFVKDPIASRRGLGSSRKPAGALNSETGTTLPASNNSSVRPPVRNFSDEQLIGIDVQDIPADMSARDFIESLKVKKR